MIHMNNVTKVYPNGSTGVENINLHINKGEFVFIVGSSGAGKSTLMKLLLKELDPTEGDIIINKVKTNELNRRQIPYLRRNLGVVFQDFRLLPNKTVYENVALSAETCLLCFLWLGWDRRAEAIPISFPAGSSRERHWQEPLRIIPLF